ncbi:RagB/SusD family nutrient uptake outer membrane protein [Aquiflexum sp.]|uniref:RagB/SusD family nutrient uptake outer membrane protein n=1 Tax=Aquiflexum sp. TaxID=1872584 RepID=UPI0035938D42
MKLYKTYIILIFCLSASSCINVLDQEPISQIASENFFRSANDAEAALVACYQSLRIPYSNNVIIPNIVLADEGWALRGGNWTRTQNFEVTATDGHLNNYWEDMYRALHRTNDVLENVPNIDDPALQKDRVLGEARFLRAFILYHLTMRYGNVPMPLETSKSIDQILSVGRSTREEIFTQAIADLTEAENLLPHDPGRKYMATKAAARGILAKVALARNSSGDLELALSKLNSITETGGYSLMPSQNYHDMFENFKQNSAESIWEISFGPTIQTGGSHNLDWETVPLIRPLGNAIRLGPDPKLVAAFDANPDDIRRTSNIRPFNSPSITNQIDHYIAKYTAGPVDPNESNRRQKDTNIIVLRLADVILLQAEILNELNRTSEAIPLLNFIRDRAGLNPTNAASQADVRLAIENERYLELAFEGHRYYDLVRTGRALAVINNYNGFNFSTGIESPRGVPPSTDRLIWPLPARDLDLNPNLLPQNPGW